MIAQLEHGSPFGITKFSDYAVVGEWRAAGGFIPESPALRITFRLRSG